MATKQPRKNLPDKVEKRGFGKGKIASGESKVSKHKFQQVVMQALLKQDGEASDEDSDRKAVEIPKEIGASLNLSKMNLMPFPKDLLLKTEPVQYLYLEGCKLTVLPENFFEKLPVLKWLDLRNNCLTSLPTVGLKNHSTLEVILLQGNRIRNLPVELATIPSLKGLQTTGNPLTNVPYDSIAEGFPGIMNHLRKLYSQSDDLSSEVQTVAVKASTSQDDTSDAKDYLATDSELRGWDLNKLSQWRQFMKKKSKSLSPGTMVNSANEKLLPRITVSVQSHKKLPTKIIPFKCGLYHRRKMMPSLRTCKKMRTRLGYKRKPVTIAMIEDKLRKEAHAAAIRETLEKQARKIQRMKDKEVLKSWRDHAKVTRKQIKFLDNYQAYPSKGFANRTPFDVDPGFLNMLNRVELYRSLKDYDNRSKRKEKPKTRLTVMDLERQMNEIISKLQKLDTDDGTQQPTTPRSKRTHVCSKMSRILDIQKTLKQLQTLNSSASIN